MAMGAACAGAGLDLSPQVTGLPRLLEIAQNSALVTKVDRVFLQLAGAVSQLPTLCDFLLSKSAVRAGLKVSELNAEMTVETAMVRANCRKN